MVNDQWSISEYIFQMMEYNWGPHEVDWFASDHNFKLKVFHSRYWNMYSTGIDTFTVDMGFMVCLYLLYF